MSGEVDKGAMVMTRRGVNQSPPLPPLPPLPLLTTLLRAVFLAGFLYAPWSTGFTRNRRSAASFWLLLTALSRLSASAALVASAYVCAALLLCPTASHPPKPSLTYSDPPPRDESSSHHATSSPVNRVGLSVRSLATVASTLFKSFGQFSMRLGEIKV